MPAIKTLSMPLLDKIKSFFSNDNLTSSPALALYDVELEKQIVVPSSEITKLPEIVANQPIMDYSSADIDWPSWLENDDLLRDEGVIFGLSESKSEEKTGIIKNYFAHQTAGLESEVELHGEKIQELNLFIEQRESRINDIKNKASVFENQVIESEHQLLRTIVGLVFSGAMCVGNYFLIEDTLRPLYGTSQWIAVGVFLAGMFNLFGKISLFHDSDSQLSWKQLLEEIGMPLAASAFVFVQALQQQPIVRSLALFGFVFFLFLFAGKLLLSNLTLLHNDLRIWNNKTSFDKELKTKTEDWDLDIVQFEKEIDEFRIQKWQIVPNLNRAEAELARLNARRDMLVKLFESEFLLARQIRERLTDRELKGFLKKYEE
jgi:hypothetical protein